MVSIIQQIASVAESNREDANQQYQYLQDQLIEMTEAFYNSQDPQSLMLRDQSLKFAILLAIIQDAMQRYQPEYLSREISDSYQGFNQRIQEMLGNMVPRYEPLWKLYNDYPNMINQRMAGVQDPRRNIGPGGQY